MYNQGAFYFSVVCGGTAGNPPTLSFAAEDCLSKYKMENYGM